jgi:general secretion pathway protein A
MYNSFFCFSEKPFNVTPDPRFFYANPRYNEAYANLLYGIRERKGFMMLTGEVGTGKTTLLHKLMVELESGVPFVFFYNTTLSFDDLLDYVCSELRLKCGGNSRLGKIQALNEFLLEQLRRNSTVALLVDEAQNLTDDVFENLRLLSNLETASEKLLQIVLAGQPELEVKLDQPSLRQIKQRMSVQCRLDCLDAEEVDAFLRHRLKVAGCKRRDLFSHETVRQIAMYSKGIPRLINIICDNALLIAYADSQKKVTAEIVKEVAEDLRLETTRGIPGVGAQTSPIPPKRKDRNGYPHFTPLRQEPPMEAPGTPLVAPAEEPMARAKALPSAEHPASEHLTPDFLGCLTQALTEAMGPMAPVVIEDQLALLGNTPTLPKGGIVKLIESAGSEVLDDFLRARFHRRMSAVVGNPNGTHATTRS